MVVADDLGYNDVGWHINKPTPANPAGRPTSTPRAGIMRTPVLDRLAAQAARLESYYVQPLCSPTRAAILTGRYPSHTGIGPDVICASCGQPYGLPARERLLPELLARAGYSTAAIGKWHVGDCHEGYLPTSRGFDSFVGYLAGGESYWNHAADFRNGTAASGLHCAGGGLLHNYSSRLYAQEAARIVKTHVQTKGRDSPLFMYLCFQSVHNPYDLVSRPGPRRADCTVQPPSDIVDINRTFPEIAVYGRRVYAGMVAALDIAVGEVVEAWEAAGLWKDTVFVFTSDK